MCLWNATTSSSVQFLFFSDFFFRLRKPNHLFFFSLTISSPLLLLLSLVRASSLSLFVGFLFFSLRLFAPLFLDIFSYFRIFEDAAKVVQLSPRSKSFFLVQCSVDHCLFSCVASLSLPANPCIASALPVDHSLSDANSTSWRMRSVACGRLY